MKQTTMVATETRSTGAAHLGIAQEKWPPGKTLLFVLITSCLLWGGIILSVWQLL